MENIICQTCLSKNRRLIPQEKVKILIRDVLDIELSDMNGGICWECHYIMLKYSKFKLQVHRAQESIIFKVPESKCFSKLSTVSKNFYDYQFSFSSDPCKEEVNTVIKSEFLSDTCENINDTSDNNDTGEWLHNQKPDINYVGEEVYVETLPFIDNDNTNHEDLTSNNTQINENINSNLDICASVKKYIIYKQNFIKIKLRNPKKIKIVKKSLIDEELKIKKSIKDEEELKIKQSLIDEEDLKKKFTKVTYNEEEEREVKRNHPNFKQLPYKCDSCVIGFTRKEKFYIHMEKKHNQSFPYICDVCLTRYPDKCRLARHVGAHYARYRCELCPYEARELWRAQDHCRRLHEADEAGRVHCPHCNMLTRTKEELVGHIKTQHAVNCNQCGQKFHRNASLTRHIHRVHRAKKEKPVYCALCNVMYRNVASYRDHLTKSANHVKRSFSCSECNRKFSSKAYVIKHYNFHHLKKSDFKCDVCDELMISALSLKTHMQMQHGHSRPREHACPDCGKKFFTLGVLRNHRLIHSEARSFKCPHCGDTFKQRAALYTHTRLRHKGLKPGKL